MYVYTHNVYRLTEKNSGLSLLSNRQHFRQRSLSFLGVSGLVVSGSGLRRPHPTMKKIWRRGEGFTIKMPTRYTKHDTIHK